MNISKILVDETWCDVLKIQSIIWPDFQALINFKLFPHQIFLISYYMQNWSWYFTRVLKNKSLLSRPVEISLDGNYCFELTIFSTALL